MHAQNPRHDAARTKSKNEVLDAVLYTTNLTLIFVHGRQQRL